MIIRHKKKNLEAYVFCIFWSDNVRHYCYLSLPYDGNGLDVLSEHDCDIITPTIGEDFVVLRNNFGEDLILHRALAENNLLDPVIENDADAMIEFARRIKLDYLENKSLFRYPPLDMMFRSEEYPTAVETEGSYYFCPKCYEGNLKANVYDEAIKCPKCEFLYNCQ